MLLSPRNDYEHWEGKGIKPWNSKSKNDNHKIGIFMWKAIQIKVRHPRLIVKMKKKGLRLSGLLINQSPLCLKRLKLNCVPVWILRDLSHYKIRRQSLHLKKNIWNFDWIKRVPLIIVLGLMKVSTCFAVTVTSIYLTIKVLA